MICRFGRAHSLLHCPLCESVVGRCTCQSMPGRHSAVRMQYETIWVVGLYYMRKVAQPGYPIITQALHKRILDSGRGGSASGRLRYEDEANEGTAGRDATFADTQSGTLGPIAKRVTSRLTQYKPPYV